MIKDDKGLKDDFGSLGIHYWMLRMHGCFGDVFFDVWGSFASYLVVAEAWQEEEEQAGDGILEMSDADGNRGLMGGFPPGISKHQQKHVKKLDGPKTPAFYIFFFSSVSGSSRLSRVSTTTRRQECEAK